MERKLSISADELIKAMNDPAALEELLNRHQMTREDLVHEAEILSQQLVRGVFDVSRV